MQKLHLVMGGRVKDPQHLEFIDLNAIDLVNANCRPGDQIALLARSSQVSHPLPCRASKKLMETHYCYY
jgi:hypothetical protein